MTSLIRVRFFATPWTAAYQASPSMGFSSQEYWSGLPFPSPGDLPNPGIKPTSPALQADALTSEPPIRWLADAKNWLIWKDPDAGKDWRREKGTTEDEMVGWHHQLNGHESGSWWWTGRPGMLQSMGSQRVRRNWSDLILFVSREIILLLVEFT